jgi:hypothetical protein
MDHRPKFTAYRMTWNLNHLEFHSITDDAELIPFPNSREVIALSQTHDYDLPNPVEFNTVAETIGLSDFPTTDVQWPIFSSQALKILCDLAEFPHREIPIRWVNAESNVDKQDFVALQLLEHLQIFDYERSKYVERDTYDPSLVQFVSEYVLHCPEGGFPPIFRVAAQPLQLFVSGETRAAFKEAYISGMAYQPLIMTEYSLEIDVPVPTSARADKAYVN